MTNNEQFLQEIKNQDFKVHDYGDSFELETWTEGGVNMFINLSKESDFKESFIDYVEKFDVSEYVDMHREHSDYRAATTIQESVNDFEIYEKRLQNIAMEFGALFKQEVDKREVFVMYTCDQWKNYTSMNTIGVSDDLNIVIEAVKNLIRNDVIALSKLELDTFDFSRVFTEGYSVLNEIEYFFINSTNLNQVEIDGGRI